MAVPLVFYRSVSTAPYGLDLGQGDRLSVDGDNPIDVYAWVSDGFGTRLRQVAAVRGVKAARAVQRLLGPGTCFILRGAP